MILWNLKQLIGENKMAKSANYTLEMVATATKMYGELGNEGMDEIATALARSVRSVRAKLVREGVYIADTKEKAAPRDMGPTKGELLESLVGMGYDVDGLDGATKPAILRLIDLVEGVVTAPDAETESEVETVESEVAEA
jgi:hypothetical protein